MARGASWGLALSLLTTSATTSFADRFDLTVALDGGAGVDGNVCTAPSSETDLVRLDCGSEVLVDPYGLAAPMVRLSWRGLELRYDGSLRLYAESGLSQVHVAALTLAHETRRWRVGGAVRGLGARFEAFPEERFIGGTAEAFGSVTRNGLELAARYRIGLREFPEQAGTPDVDQWLLGSFRMTGRSPVRPGIGGEARRRDAADPGLTAWRFAFLAWADASWGPVTARADLEVASRVFDVGRHDLETLVGGEIGLRLARGIALVLRGSHDRVGSSSSELSYVRPTAELVLRIESSIVVGREELPPYRPRAGEDGRWRFRIRAQRARTVAVVGDFNSWDESRGRLRRARDGEWAGSVVVPRGRHLYLFLVDGAPIRPPDAEAYAPDGFGGENGVLHVP